MSAIDNETAALQRKKAVDNEGFATDTAGNRVNMAGDSLLSIYNSLKSYGLNDQQANRIAREFADQNGNIPIVNNPGQARYGAPFDSLSVAILKAAQTELFKNGASPGVNTATTPTTATSSPTSSGTPVTINLPGTTGTVNVVSQSDANTLVRVLESAFGRSA